MAIIYSYPTITPSSDDLILLTDNSSSKATKTASISDILSLSGATSDIYLKKTLNHTQILTLFSSPVEILPALAVDKGYFIQSPIIIQYNFATTRFTSVGGTDMFFYYRGGTTGPASFVKSLITAPASSIIQATPNYSTTPPALPNVGGYALDLQAETNDFGGAAEGTLDIHLIYRIIDL